jgi:DNA-directed RNA polymerase II subunit RPB1
MSIYKELSYNQDVETISGLQFSIMSAEEIENRSVAEIVSTDTFAGNDPIIGGLFDPRMGVIDHNKICQTCEQKNTFCPGHFGHIVLAKPLFYIQFFDVVKKLMKCICFKCSKLLLDKDQPELKKILSKRISKQKKFEFIYKLCSKNKIKRCGKDIKNNGCGAKQPDKISKDTHVGRIVLEWKTKEEEEDIEDMILFGSDVYRIFSRITDEDSNIIGFPRNINKPEDLICTVFPVPPPSVRPSVRNDTGQRCEDDLTHKLCDIVKTNNTLKTKIEKNVNKEQIDYWTILLQYHLSTFIDNKIPGIPQAKQRTGRPLRSLGERLKSKEGRIRGNLMGKRVDYSARSVITPDPRISINELGVPIKIAMNLTFPERVNKYNREKLTKLITNGPDNYPGAKYIRKANQDYRTIRIKNLDITTINLEDNDIVDRHMMNGDFILFNRQPSLHKMSMMSHKVKVMPYDTFRLNPAVTPSYNADYDGDEMNLHLPQSVQTENELKMLSNVTSQIISPRESKPIISVVQDVTLGLYRLTKDTSMLNEKQVFNLMMTNTKFKGVVPEPIYVKDDVKKWNGKQLLSEILPPNLNVVNKNNQYDESNKNNKDNLIVIEDGKIKQGVFDKKIYQDRTNGLVHILFNDNGQDEARHLFDNTQKLICDWLVYSGFSVGISDLVISKEMNDEMKKVINDMKVKVYDIIRKVHENNYENNSFDSNKQNFENDVNKLLNDARNEVGKIALKNITDDNRMINMIKSKSKGNPVNIAQMISTLGQQNVDGKRIPDGFTDRTLPHFTKYDDGPESRGFVENSFINGLTPQEFYFHAMGGREGLIDTAVKTSETGYLQRRLIKSMEDCKINYDLTVRNATGSIVQFLYGEDGINANKLENHSLPFIGMEPSELQETYLLKENDIIKNIFQKKVFEQTIKSKETFDRCLKHYKEILEDRHYLITEVFKCKDESRVLYPISIKRIITNAISIFHKKKTRSDLSPLEVLDDIDGLVNELYLNDNNKGNKLLEILLKTSLTPKKILLKDRLNKLSFEYVKNEIIKKFRESIAHPSEMVGVVSAQSIGEPCTQITLNTFHSAGISSASQTVRGVPRIKELLNNSKNIKGPSTKVYLNENINKDYNKCKEVLNILETTYIKDIVKSSSIYYDKSDDVTTIGDDSEFLKLYKMYEENCNVSSPWLLRFKFNKEKMYNLGVTMHDIYHTITKYYEDIIECQFSDDNSDELVFRIRLVYEEDDNKSKIDKNDIITELKALEHNIIENIIIKGIEGIKKVILLENKDMKYNSDTMKFEKNTEWYMDTNGNNLLDILIQKNVDSKRTISNNINEVLEILGIEAAREVLLNELNEVLDQEGVNFRHLSLLVDTMTNKGNILSIDRHGINRSDIGPLAKCSFEETTDMLIKAGLFGEYDKMNGVSGNIMLGQIPPCGTGDTKILIDEEKLMNINKREIEDMDEIDGGLCNEENLEFDFEIPTEELEVEKTEIKLNIV